MSPSRRRAIGAVRGMASRTPSRAPCSYSTPVPRCGRARCPHRAAAPSARCVPLHPAPPPPRRIARGGSPPRCAALHPAPPRLFARGRAPLPCPTPCAPTPPAPLRAHRPRPSPRRSSRAPRLFPVEVGRDAWPPGLAPRPRTPAPLFARSPRRPAPHPRPAAHRTRTLLHFSHEKKRIAVQYVYCIRNLQFFTERVPYVRQS